MESTPLGFKVTAPAAMSAVAFDKSVKSKTAKRRPSIFEI
jgi:hypothetical protein